MFDTASNPRPVTIAPNGRLSARQVRLPQPATISKSLWPPRQPVPMLRCARSARRSPWRSVILRWY